MTEVTFYVLADLSSQARLQTACKLIEKAVQRRHQVHVQAASQSEAEAIDELLWGLRPESFIAHCLATEAVTALPAVRIGWPGHTPASHDLLLHLAAEFPETPQRFRRILEIVGGDEAEREHSRTHWRQYRQLGLKVDSHQIG